MPRFRSLLWQIMGLHVLALAAAAIAVPLATYFLLSSTAASFENRTLRAHADTIASYLAPNAQGRWTLSLPDDLRTFYLHEFDGFAYSVIDGEGRVEYSSLLSGAPILRSDLLKKKAVYFSRASGKAIYYGASIPESRNGKTVWVEVAQDLEHPDVIFDDIVAGFLRRVAWFTIPIMLVLFVVDILIVTRALRPVVHASELARAIDPANLALRLPTEALPLEILPLVRAVNQGLERIERGFRTLRDFTADAAHELRTPLSVLRLRAETALPPEGTRALRKDFEIMSHVVEQLLAAAELEGSVVGANETADLRDVASDVVSLLAPIALQQGKDIALGGEPAPVLVVGNAAMLLQAIRNLAENAIAHTPKGTTVEIEVDKEGVVRVLDEGPGVSESEREHLFKRFWRRDRTRTGGAGLGLAIVWRIVEAHGARVEVQNRTPHGAVFSIRLRPLNPGATPERP